MGCPTVTVKVSTIVFNVIFALFAIGIIVWVACNPDSTRPEIAIGCYVLFSLIVLFCILGCFAVIKESVCLAATCAIFLLLIAILQIAGAIVEMNNDERPNGLQTVQQAWERNEMDGLQTIFQCCGKSSAQDYVLLNKPVPASCYERQNTKSALNIWIEGCSYKLQEYYDEEHFKLVVISWTLVGFELLGCVLFVFLVINFRNKQRRMQF